MVHLGEIKLQEIVNDLRPETFNDFEKRFVKPGGIWETTFSNVKSIIFWFENINSVFIIRIQHCKYILDY